MYEHRKKKRKLIAYPYNVYATVFEIEKSDESIRKNYYDAFSQLSERSQKIIESYFRDLKTLDEIAQELRLTPERVRQLTNIALHQIHHIITERNADI